MKYVFLILLVTSLTFLLATNEKKEVQKATKESYGTVAPVSSQPCSVAQVHKTSRDQVQISCKERCCRDCVMPVGLHCVGVIFWCHQTLYCRGRT